MCVFVSTCMLKVFCARSMQLSLSSMWLKLHRAGIMTLSLHRGLCGCLLKCFFLQNYMYRQKTACYYNNAMSCEFLKIMLHVKKNKTKIIKNVLILTFPQMLEGAAFYSPLVERTWCWIVGCTWGTMMK